MCPQIFKAAALNGAGERGRLGGEKPRFRVEGGSSSKNTLSMENA